jgi:hypothetical protein
MRVFADRADAGRQLAERLGHLRGQDAVVLGLPRGGCACCFSGGGGAAGATSTGDRSNRKRFPAVGVLAAPMASTRHAQPAIDKPSARTGNNQTKIRRVTVRPLGGRFAGPSPSG